MQHKADMFSMGCVLYELLTDQRAFGRPEDEDLAPDQLRQQVLLRHAAWVSSHPAACLVCPCFSTTSILAICLCEQQNRLSPCVSYCSIWRNVGRFTNVKPYSCLDSCLRVNSFAISPVLDLDFNLVTCHGRASIHTPCNHAFSWSMPVVPLRDFCVSFSQWCAGVVKPSGAPGSAAVHMFCYCSHVVQGTDSSQGRLVPHRLDVLKQSVNNPEKCRQAVDLLQHMLRLEPSQRLSIQAALSHPFLQD